MTGIQKQNSDHSIYRAMSCYTALLLCFFTVMIIPGQAHAKSNKVYNPVENLQYHQALYYFYLDETFNALTQLSIKDKRNDQVLNEASNLLKTALQLDYGMELSAIELLQTLDRENQDLKNTDQLWLYLAQLFYEKQDYDVTESSLHNIHKLKHKKDQNQKHYLSSQLALKSLSMDEVYARASELKKDSIFYSYINYNIAIHLYQQGAYSEALVAVDQLLEHHNADLNQEYRLLYQRLLITAAYMHFYRGSQQKAIDYFSRIAIDSVFLDEALLGFGRAAFENNNTTMATALWEKLQAYPLVTNRKIEAGLSLAALNEKQQQFDHALSIYEQSEQLCQLRLYHLDQLEQAFDARELWRIFSDYHHIEIAQHKTMDKLPSLQALLRDNPFLVDLINQQAFATQLDQLRDLDEMQKQVGVWQQELPVYLDLLDVKMKTYEKKRTLTHSKQSEFDLSHIFTQQSVYQETLKTIKNNKDVFALLNANEKLLLDKIVTSKATINLTEDDPFHKEYLENIRRIEGVFLWDAYEHYPFRLYQAEAALHELNKAITQNQSLQKILTDSTAQDIHLPDFEQRINVESSAIDATLSEIIALSQKAKSLLRHDFIEAINTEKNNTLAFQRHSRLAIARVSEHFLEDMPLLDNGEAL